MPSWNLPPAPPPPPPPSGDPAGAVEDAVNAAVDGAGKVVDAVTDAAQTIASNPTTPAAPAPIPLPYPNLAATGAALQGFGDFAQQAARDMGGGTRTSVSAAAGIVSEALARTIPVVIGVLGAALAAGGGSDGGGGIGGRLSSLIGLLASEVERLLAALGRQGAAAPRGGQDAANQAARGLRELGQVLLRDARWQRANVQELANRLAARPRPRSAAPVAGNGSEADAARVRRMLMRLSVLEEKLRRLETQLAIRGPKFTSDPRPLASLRASLQVVLRAASGPQRPLGRG